MNAGRVTTEQQQQLLFTEFEFNLTDPSAGHAKQPCEESEPLLQKRCVATCRRLAPKQISRLQKQNPQDFIPMHLLIMTLKIEHLDLFVSLPPVNKVLC